MTDDAWAEAKAVIGGRRVLAGPQLSQQLLDGDHWVMVGARYRAAAALIGSAERVLEVGVGEGIGAAILAKGRRQYVGIDPDIDLDVVRTTVRRGICRATEFARGTLCSLSVCADRRYHDDFGAAVALDVIEHVPPDESDHFLFEIARHLGEHGVAVIGTPSKHAEHLASPQSRAGHVNLKTPDELRALMAKYFHVVQEFGMQSTELGLGHPGMRHYLICVGISPK